MQKVLSKINSNDLFADAQELYNLGLQTKNTSTRYRYWQEARSLEKIAKELVKYELPTRGY